MNTYTIKELSEKFNIPQSTLRYYEELGLLCNVDRNASNQRVYIEEHVNKLNAIHCFKNASMTLPQIKQFFDYEKDEVENIDSMLSLLQEQESKVALQFEQLQSAYAHINNKLKFYNAIKEALNNNEQPPSWDEFFNEKVF
ncbi:MAG: MerR family transcriptional regulator [Peptostreptococcaceae bacterium]